MAFLFRALLERMMVRVLLTSLMLFAATAEAGVPALAVHHFQLGEAHYESGNFEAAVAAFTKAIEAAPMESEYHRQLGRAYGRLAEESSWLTALGLVRKTRKQLERAVALDDENLKAISDLIDFYEQAPGLLGGSGSGAKRLRAHLAAVCSRHGIVTSETVCVEQLTAQ
jgi:tetratricopeptide (TPR) repeat protein